MNMNLQCHVLPISVQANIVEFASKQGVGGHRKAREGGLLQRIVDTVSRRAYGQLWLYRVSNIN
jgi:hypothetical protein